MAYELIYYGKCSTCVKGLALLQENNISPLINNYMTTPLSEHEISAIAKKVGSVKKILREKTAIEIGLDINASDDELIVAISQNPKLLQRPILIKGDLAIVGRPIEEMLKLK